MRLEELLNVGHPYEDRQSLTHTAHRWATGHIESVGQHLVRGAHAIVHRSQKQSV